MHKRTMAATVIALLAVTLTSSAAPVGAIEGDITLNGILGLDKTVRNGFSGIRATFKIKGDASDEVLEQIVHQSVARSAVFDVLTNGVPVTVAAIAN